MPSIIVKDGNGNIQTVQTVPTVGSAAMSASLPVTMATDQTAIPLNATQVAGVAIATGIGASSSSTQRVAVSTDSTIALSAGAAVIGYLANPSTIYSNQYTVTASAASVGSQALSNGVVITAKSSNTGVTYIGPSGVTTGTGYALSSGQSISYAVTNLSAIFAIGTASDILYITGN